MKRGKMTNIELKELIELKVESIKNEIKPSLDLIDYKLNELREINCTEHPEIITHQKITNSRVTHLEEENIERDKNLFIVSWINKNPKITILIFIMFWFVLSGLSKYIDPIDLVIKIFN